MEEGRVAEHGDYAHFITLNSVKDLLRPMPKADAGSHADSGLHGVIRRAGSKRVTTDVPRNHNVLAAAKLIEETAMRAASAKRGRTRYDG